MDAGKESRLQSLLERLEKASGGDRALDAALYWRFLEENKAERELWWVTAQFTVSPVNGDWRSPFTSSLDAALSLVERVLPGWTRSVDATVPELGIDVDLHPPTGPVVRGTHASEAIATCLALVRAKLEDEAALKAHALGEK